MTAAAMPAWSGPAFRSAARSDAGCVRTENQDRVLDRGDAGLWAVADGMGGHADGAAAAQCVIDALGAIQHDASGYKCLAEIEASIAAVNAALFDRSTGGPTSGSTLVALLIREAHFACLWAGDSRAYLLRDGRLTRLTHDHSIVQELVDAGGISEGARRNHPRANAITRAVGAAAGLRLDQRFGTVAPGDRFLLCSDGLQACVEDDELCAILVDEPIVTITDRLVALALSRGSPDNISVVVADAA